MQFQPRDPPTFSGRSSDDPEFWVGQVSNFFRLVGGSPNKQVAYASTLLQGTAQHWWQRLVKAKRIPRDWKTFAKQLIGRFQNSCKADIAMSSLMNIRQKKWETIHDCICRFEADLDKVETYDESWIIKMFIWGLHQDQAIFVAQKRPGTLRQAFQLARNAAMAALMSKRPGSSGQSDSGKQKGFGWRQEQQTSQLLRRGRRSRTVSSNASQIVNYPIHSHSSGNSCGKGQASSKQVPRFAVTGH